ncbi:MAG: hypothetical protein SNJ53_08440 [Thermodesulfovibrionales bacterium]
MIDKFKFLWFVRGMGLRRRNITSGREIFSLLEGLRGRGVRASSRQ